MKRILYILISTMVSCQLISARANGQNYEKIHLAVDTNKVLIKDFVGFGAEWDPGFWAEYNVRQGINNTDWDLETRRIAWMRLPFVRMFMLTQWVTNGDSMYSWDNPQLEDLYKYLNFCQREHITVFLTDWGIHESWEKVPGFTGNSDPRYAETIGKYLDYLINHKGYSCIKYFIFVNEPNFEAGGWGAWEKGIDNISKIIKERRLPVKLVGSDEVAGFGWQIKTVDSLRNKFSVWDMHEYVPQKQIISGAFEDTLAKDWEIVKRNDPNWKNKFLMLAEIGASDGDIGAAINDSSDTYGYGLNMADMAVQATLAGTSAISAWMLGDESHEGFDMGMWKNKAGNFQLRPWFYAWTLLTRHFTERSKIFDDIRKYKEFRYLIAETKDDNWSICLINRGNDELDVTLNGNLFGKSKTFYLSSYNDKYLALDFSGFLVPIKKLFLDAGRGLSVHVPPHCIIVLSTFN